MAQVVDDDLIVEGGIEAGNWWFGIARVMAEADQHSSTTVSGITVEGTESVSYQTTPRTKYPWKDVQEASVNNVSDTSFDVVIRRTNDTGTDVFWMVWRTGPSARQEEEDGVE